MVFVSMAPTKKWKKTFTVPQYIVGGRKDNYESFFVVREHIFMCDSSCWVVRLTVSYDINGEQIRFSKCRKSKAETMNGLVVGFVLFKNNIGVRYNVDVVIFRS
jgi:hypothetical protein